MKLTTLFKGVKCRYTQSPKKLYTTKKGHEKKGDFKPSVNVAYATLDTEYIPTLTKEYLDREKYGYIEVIEPIDRGAMFLRTYQHGVKLKKKRALEVEFIIINNEVYNLNKAHLEPTKKDKKGQFKQYNKALVKDTTQYNYKGKGNKQGLFKAQRMTDNILKNI